MGISGSSGNDVLTGSNGNDVIAGNGGDDQIAGGRGNDFLLGNGGNDFLEGNRGADILYGGQGNDTINGGLDNDYLSGDKGFDTLTGSGGADTFGFKITNNNNFIDGADVITDFNVGGGDKLSLVNGNYNDLSFVQDGADVDVYYDGDLMATFLNRTFTGTESDYYDLPVT